MECAVSRFYLSHPVKDFDVWKPMFDADESRRQQAGLTTVGVYRQADDTTQLLIVMEGNDSQAVRDMLCDPSLGELMKQAGVLAPPEAYAGEAL